MSRYSERNSTRVNIAPTIHRNDDEILTAMEVSSATESLGIFAGRAKDALFNDSDFSMSEFSPEELKGFTEDQIETFGTYKSKDAVMNHMQVVRKRNVANNMMKNEGLATQLGAGLVASVLDPTEAIATALGGSYAAAKLAGMGAGLATKVGVYAAEGAAQGVAISALDSTVDKVTLEQGASNVAIGAAMAGGFAILGAGGKAIVSAARRKQKANIKEAIEAPGEDGVPKHADEADVDAQEAAVDTIVAEAVDPHSTTKLDLDVDPQATDAPDEYGYVHTPHDRLDEVSKLAEDAQMMTLIPDNTNNLTPKGEYTLHEAAIAGKQVPKTDHARVEGQRAATARGETTVVNEISDGLGLNSWRDTEASGITAIAGKNTQMPGSNLMANSQIEIETAILKGDKAKPGETQKHMENYIIGDKFQNIINDALSDKSGQKLETLMKQLSNKDLYKGKEKVGKDLKNFQKELNNRIKSLQATTDGAINLDIAEQKLKGKLGKALDDVFGKQNYGSFNSESASTAVLRRRMETLLGMKSNGGLDINTVKAEAADRLRSVEKAGLATIGKDTNKSNFTLKTKDAAKLNANTATAAKDKFNKAAPRSTPFPAVKNETPTIKRLRNTPQMFHPAAIQMLYKEYGISSELIDAITRGSVGISKLVYGARSVSDLDPRVHKVFETIMAGGKDKSSAESLVQDILESLVYAKQANGGAVYFNPVSDARGDSRFSYKGSLNPQSKVGRAVLVPVDKGNQSAPLMTPAEKSYRKHAVSRHLVDHGDDPLSMAMLATGRTELDARTSGLQNTSYLTGNADLMRHTGAKDTPEAGAAVSEALSDVYTHVGGKSGLDKLNLTDGEIRNIAKPMVNPQQYNATYNTVHKALQDAIYDRGVKLAKAGDITFKETSAYKHLQDKETLKEITHRVIDKVKELQGPEIDSTSKTLAHISKLLNEKGVETINLGGRAYNITDKLKAEKKVKRGVGKNLTAADPNQTKGLQSYKSAMRPAINHHVDSDILKRVMEMAEKEGIPMSTIHDAVVTNVGLTKRMREIYVQAAHDATLGSSRADSFWSKTLDSIKNDIAVSGLKGPEIDNLMISLEADVMKMLDAQDIIRKEWTLEDALGGFTLKGLQHKPMDPKLAATYKAIDAEPTPKPSDVEVEISETHNIQSASNTELSSHKEVIDASEVTQVKRKKKEEKRAKAAIVAAGENVHKNRVANNDAVNTNAKDQVDSARTEEVNDTLDELIEASAHSTDVNRKASLKMMAKANEVVGAATDYKPVNKAGSTIYSKFASPSEILATTKSKTANMLSTLAGTDMNGKLKAAGQNVISFAGRSFNRSKKAMVPVEQAYIKAMTPQEKAARMATGGSSKELDTLAARFMSARTKGQAAENAFDWGTTPKHRKDAVIEMADKLDKANLDALNLAKKHKVAGALEITHTPGYVPQRIKKQAVLTLIEDKGVDDAASLLVSMLHKSDQPVAQQLKAMKYYLNDLRTVKSDVKTKVVDENGKSLTQFHQRKFHFDMDTDGASKYFNTDILGNVEANQRALQGSIGLAENLGLKSKSDIIVMRNKVNKELDANGVTQAEKEGAMLAFDNMLADIQHEPRQSQLNHRWAAGTPGAVVSALKTSMLAAGRLTVQAFEYVPIMLRVGPSEAFKQIAPAMKQFAKQDAAMFQDFLEHGLDGIDPMIMRRVAGEADEGLDTMAKTASRKFAHLINNASLVESLTLMQRKLAVNSVQGRIRAGDFNHRIVKGMGLDASDLQSFKRVIESGQGLKALPEEVSERIVQGMQLSMDGTVLRSGVGEAAEAIVHPVMGLFTTFMQFTLQAQAKYVNTTINNEGLKTYMYMTAASAFFTGLAVMARDDAEQAYYEALGNDKKVKSIKKRKSSDGYMMASAIRYNALLGSVTDIGGRLFTAAGSDVPWEASRYSGGRKKSRIESVSPVASKFESTFNTASRNIGKLFDDDTNFLDAVDDMANDLPGMSGLSGLSTLQGLKAVVKAPF